MTGYSGTPLAKKLGIKNGSRILPWNAPMDYATLVGPLPQDAEIVSGLKEGPDIVHILSSNKADLSELLRLFRSRVQGDCAIWVSWPKKSSKVPTDITEDTIRGIALPLGFVDIKVCAVDEVWSGLKLVIRRENRGKE